MTTAEAASLMRVDDEGLWFSAPVTDPVSVFVDGARIWSVQPRLPKSGSDEVCVSWPDALRPYLNGTAEISVRRLTGEALFSGEVSLGSGVGRLRVATSDGTALAVDKTGHVSPTFGATPEEDRQRVVEAMNQALEILHDNGTPAFVAFGCLLGAVREGRLIGHDNDADLVYLARSSHPFDIIVESFELERLFLDQGWTSQRMSGGDFKLWIPMSDGSKVGCDVFTGFYRGDELIVMPSVRAEMPLSELLPTRPVVLEGIEVAGPANPEALLAATYGESWRIPDPTFSFTPSRATRRLLTGWMRGERRHQNYWEDFYAMRAAAVRAEPSPFARWVAERESERGELIDIGCGTGRDSLWLAEQGFTTVGCDYSKAAVDHATQRAQAQQLSATFQQLNLYDVRDVLTTGAVFAHDHQARIIYARFLVHAVEDGGRRNLWLLSRSALRGTRGRVYLEFRTEPTVHEFGEHFRQFVRPEVVQSELESYGFDIEHCEDSYGLAVHNNEDPRVCRIAAKMR